jgi:hypothetical protein
LAEARRHVVGRVAVMKSFAWAVLLGLLAVVYGAAMFIHPA